MVRDCASKRSHWFAWLRSRVLVGSGAFKCLVRLGMTYNLAAQEDEPSSERPTPPMSSTARLSLDTVKEGLVYAHRIPQGILNRPRRWPPSERGHQTGTRVRQPQHRRSRRLAIDTTGCASRMCGRRRSPAVPNHGPQAAELHPPRMQPVRPSGAPGRFPSDAVGKGPPLPAAPGPADSDLAPWPQQLQQRSGAQMGLR